MSCNAASKFRPTADQSSLRGAVPPLELVLKLYSQHRRRCLADVLWLEDVEEGSGRKGGQENCTFED